MEVEDAGQGSGKKPAKITIKFKDKDSGPSKKIGKTKISKKRKLLGTTSTGKNMKVIDMIYIKITEQKEKRKEEEERKAAEDEQKRKADEEAATKAKEKTTKKKIKEAKREARKKLAKNKQPEEDTEENLSDTEEYDDQSDDAAAKAKADEEIEKRKATLIAELKAIEKRAEKQAKVAAEAEDDADQNDDVDEVLTNIETLPFLNTPKRSKKKEDGKDITKTVNETKDNMKRKFERSGSEEPEKKKINRQKSTYKGTMKKSGSHKKPIMEESPKRFTRGDAKKQGKFENVNEQNEAEDDEDVRSVSSDNEKEQMIVEAKKKGRKSKGKKEAKKMKKAEEQNQVESGEDDVLYEGSNSDNERLPVGKAKKTQKKTKKAESSTSKSYLKYKSNNESEKEENNESNDEDELKQVKKDKKRIGSKAEKPYPTCNTRSSPKALYEAMMTLSDPRKKCLKDMGFERMIHFPIVELPSALAFHLIEHFHPESMELRLERGSIKITRQKVNDMLGIPMGSRKLEDLEQKPSNDPFIKKWEEQFRHLKKPTPPPIASVISDTEEAIFMFKMNFVTLFGSTMGTLENGGRVSTKLLKRISEDVDISNIDWCGYILDCLRTSKNNWKDVKTRNNFYYGPLTFICLLYLDSTIFPDLRVMRHRPALRSWNTTTMKKKITMETEKRCLGKLEHHGEFDPKEEQDGLNLYKGLDVYVVLINDREPKTKEYVELFNDDEFNQYESSNDEDSEGDADADNEKNNNNDDDRAPTTDANKQNESENKKEDKNKEDIDKGIEEGSSEGTEESGSKGTKEDESKGKYNEKEVQDDEKEEKMTGDNREVAVQMDVDNQNEEKVEKEKEKQDKGDKVENVQEKQDADTIEKVQEIKDQDNHLTEDEFWNTQTDSQIDMLMSQAEIVESDRTP
ncbi:hypothetical protein Tco_1337055 [Tanacetum coccineum]